MEKRFTLALVLSILVLVVWQWKFAPKPEPRPKKDTTPEVTSPTPGPVNAPSKPEAMEPPAGDVARVTLENERLRLVFSNMGAVLESAELLDAHPKAGDQRPLRLISPSPVGLNALRLEDPSNALARFGDQVWSSELKTTDSGQEVRYERSVATGSSASSTTYGVRKIFTLPAGDVRHLRVRFEFFAKGSSESGDLILPRNFVLLVSGGVFLEQGQGVTPPRSGFFAFDDDYEEFPQTAALKEGGGPEDGGVLGALLDPASTGGVRKSISGDHRFVCDLGTFFGAFFSLDDYRTREGTPLDVVGIVHSVSRPAGSGWGHAHEGDDGGSADARTASLLAFRQDLTPRAEIFCEGTLYLGPIDESFLVKDLQGTRGDAAKAMSQAFDEQMGFARFIGDIVIWALRGLHGFTGNWGWAIVLLTLCVRAILFPINRRSQAAMLRHSEGMARVKPKLDALKKKYEKDPRRYAKEQMELMKSEGVSLLPLSGCLPILLQIPIFFGLFSALRSSIDLRQAPWWWVSDLSQPDGLVRFATEIDNPMGWCCCNPVGAPPITGLHLLPLLMTGAWVLNSYFMPKPKIEDPQLAQQRKIMMFMPIFFGLMMYSYAAGLSLYWLTSSLVGIVESRVIKKLMGPPKTGDGPTSISLAK